MFDITMEWSVAFTLGNHGQLHVSLKSVLAMLEGMDRRDVHPSALVSPPILAPFGGWYIADAVVISELPVLALVLHNSETNLEFRASDTWPATCKVKRCWCNCIMVLMTSNIFKEHIWTFTSEITAGHHSCKECLVLMALSAAADNLP